ncbi:hypothetical protein C496_08841 [Natronorubrum tibetense GA33]|uniref:Uncharacterized protein n=1 Tax=Natronorubrum tibetense GA33 TaxID=1114856 RepID=L9VXI6_9EURY|nr:hypothetical protein C496_08841 [Natronorubrum tibetense GA33]
MLVGLGTIVAGGGAALGTGAFSSVEAERNVEIEVAGDQSAVLGLEITNDTLSGGESGDGSDDQIKFDPEENLNQNSITTFDDALKITNNGSENVNVDIHEAVLGEDLDDGNSLVTDNGTETGMNFIDDSNDLTELSDTASLDIIFDLDGEDDDSAIPDNIVIEATTE